MGLLAPAILGGGTTSDSSHLQMFILPSPQKSWTTALPCTVECSEQFPSAQSVRARVFTSGQCNVRQSFTRTQEDVMLEHCFEDGYFLTNEERAAMFQEKWTETYWHSKFVLHNVFPDLYNGLFFTGNASHIFGKKSFQNPLALSFGWSSRLLLLSRHALHKSLEDDKLIGLLPQQFCLTPQACESCSASRLESTSWKL